MPRVIGQGKNCRTILVDPTEIVIPEGTRGWFVKNALYLTPGGRLARSPSKAARRFLAEASDTNFLRAGTEEGIIVRPVETFIESRKLKDMGGTIARARDAFRRYRKAGGTEIRTLGDFRTAVSHAMRRGDVSAFGGKAGAAVEEAAREYRRLFDGLLADAKEVGLLSDIDIEEGFVGTADSFLPRVFDIPKINADEEKFIQDLIRGWRAAGRPESDEFLRQSAHEVIERIRKVDRNQLNLNVIPGAQTMKGRTIGIRDEFLEPYLIDDVEELARRYTNTLAGRIELAGRFSPDVTKRLDKLEARLARLQEEIDSPGDLSRAVGEINERIGDIAAERFLDDADAARLRELVEQRAALREQVESAGENVAVIRGELASAEKEIGALREKALEAVEEDGSAVIADPFAVDVRGLIRRGAVNLEEGLEKEVTRLRRHIASVKRANASDGYNVRGLKKKIRSDFRRLKDQVRENAELTESRKKKELSRLSSELQRTLKDVDAVAGRLVGTYGIPADPEHWVFRTSQALKRTAFITKLGNVVISSLPDAMLPVFVNGMRPMRKVAGALVKSPHKVMKSADKTEILRLLRAVEFAGLHKRSMSIADIVEEGAQNTLLERGLKALSDHAGKVFGIDFWNGTMQHLSGFMAIQRFMDDIVKLKAGALDKAGLRNLRLAGFDDELIDAVHAEYIAGKIEKDADGIWTTDTDVWADRTAARNFEVSILRTVRNTILRPGAADLPRIFSDPALSVLFQFQSYAFTANNRILISGLQRADRAVMTGAMGMIGLGMLGYSLSQLSKGKDVSDDWRVWALEGIDRSGLLGWVTTANNMLDRSLNFGVQSMLGLETASRFNQRSRFDALAGPGFGVAEQALEFVAEPSLRSARPIIPFNTHFLIRRPVDAFIAAQEENQ